MGLSSVRASECHPHHFSMSGYGVPEGPGTWLVSSLVQGLILVIQDVGLVLGSIEETAFTFLYLILSLSSSFLYIIWPFFRLPF